MSKKLVAFGAVLLVLLAGAAAVKWWQDSETIRDATVYLPHPIPEWWSRDNEIDTVDRRLKNLDGVWFCSEDAARKREELLQIRQKLEEEFDRRAQRKAEAERKAKAEAEEANRIEANRQEALRIAAEKRKREEEETKRAAAEREAKFAAIAKEAKALPVPEGVRSEPPSGLRGKALILSESGRHDDHAKLPDALRGEPDDPELIVFQVVGYSEAPGTSRYVARSKAIPLAGVKSQEYQIGSRLTVTKVRVIDWKSKAILGTFQVTGPEPPASVTIPVREDGYPDTSPIRGPAPALGPWAARCFSTAPPR